MKLWLLVFILAAGAAFGQADAPAARAEALRQFPDLAEPNSEFNRAFLKAVAELRQKDPSILSREDWPVTVAYQVGAQLGIKPTARPGVVSLREMETDLPSFIGRTVLIEGKIDISDYFNYGYSGAGNTHYSFTLRDDSGRGQCYGLREASDSLRQLILAHKGKPIAGVFQIRISDTVRHTANEGVMADLLKVVLVYPNRSKD